MQHFWLKTTHHIKRKEPHNGTLSLKSPTCFRLQISLKANQSHLPKSILTWNYNTNRNNIRKSLVICGTQLAGGLLLKMLKFFKIMLNIFEFPT